MNWKVYRSEGEKKRKIEKCYQERGCRNRNPRKTKQAQVIQRFLNDIFKKVLVVYKEHNWPKSTYPEKQYLQS